MGRSGRACTDGPSFDRQADRREERQGARGARRLAQDRHHGFDRTTRNRQPVDAASAIRLQQARPNKTRFEVHVRDKTSVRVFNGVEGWKLHQSHNGSPEVAPYTAEEIAAARDGLGIDGPLIDYQAKGIGVDFDGIDEVAGKKAYRLNVKLPSGATRRWWIDAATFLDLKYERESRTSTGQSATVTVSFANYKTVDGLLIPHSTITGEEGGKAVEAMLIEQVFLNRPMGEKVFTEPRAPTHIKPAHSSTAGSLRSGLTNIDIHGKSTACLMQTVIAFIGDS